MTFEQQLIEYGAECEAKGIKKKEDELVIAMLNDGFNAQTVARYATGYSVEQIEQMKSQINEVNVA